MSDLIRLLPDHIANQIAAGEVIQRPASVVKEMMENAIDAGADQIKVIIKDAGKTLIQIIDNGSGMSRSDAVMCFERHATSKVQSADDLFALKTKGFRGEALASVAAIAHVTLRTKRKEDELGTLIEMEGSRINRNEPCVCPNGASFEVKNLFFNVPARRNFLKSDNVEFGHILDEFERVALAHPELSFQLIHNDNVVFQLQEGNLRKRIVDILGRSSNEKLVPIEEKTDIVEVYGFVGKPEFAKKNRGEQYFFVNNRYFRDNYFNHALNKAFEGLVQPKYFPSYFLFLKVDPKKIDVNVHPTKTEIKFEEDRSIYAILLSSIRQALGIYQVMPAMDFERESGFELPYEMREKPAVEPVIRVNPEYNPFQSTPVSRSTGSGQLTPALKAQGFGSKEVSPADWQEFYKIEDVPEPETTMEIRFEGDLGSTQDYILRGKYLFTTTKSGILIIDTQRAHERIVYDKIINKFISSPIESQTMLFPLERTMNNTERTSWEDNRVLLERLGFKWEVNGNELVFSGVPSILEDESISVCIDEILREISMVTIDKGEMAHILVSSIANAAGNRKGIVNKQSAGNFIEQLFACTEHAFSPRGKKIMQTISMEEIANKF